MENKILKCPHCELGISLDEIKCGIMRCGIYKLKNGKWKQMPKHGKEETIKKILNNNEYFGCGNPLGFRKDLNILIGVNWNRKKMP